MSATAEPVELISPGVIDPIEHAGDLIRLRDALDDLPAESGFRTTYETKKRWARLGFVAPNGERIVLPSVRIGMQLMTTRAAVAWWMTAVSRAARRAPRRS